MPSPALRSTALASLAALLLLPPATGRAQQPAPAPSRAEVVARLDSLVNAYLAEMPSAGLSVGVVKGRDTLLWRGYGAADREGARPASMRTVYRVGSITKQFTAAAIMQLVEQGRLALDDTLGRHLPGYPRWGGVTIRQLLTHTSGLPNYSTHPRLGAQAVDLPRDSVMAAVRDDPFAFPTGSIYGYSNTNYFLLGMVLERLTGMPYDRLIQERFFSPLGMVSARYCPRRYDGEHAVGYALNARQLARSREVTMTIPFAAGALCMSVPDYLRWQEALTAGRAVSGASFRAMATSHRLANGAPTNYGLGLAMGTLGGHPVLRHGGGISGFSTEGAWLPDDSLRIAVFANVAGRSPRALVQNMASAVLGLPLQRAVDLPPAVPLAASDRDRFIGTYEIVQPNGRVTTLRVTADEDGLAGQASGPPAGQAADTRSGPSGGPRFPLVHIGGAVFASPLDPNYRLTFVTENGRVVKVIRKNAQSTVEGRPVP